MNKNENRTLNLPDNSHKQFSVSENRQYLENFRVIANKTIGNLQEESNILIFPPKAEETDDQIKNSVIFSLKENEDKFCLETGNIMGFIGKNDTELNICSRFTHKNNGNVCEENDFFLHYMLEKVCHINLTNLKNTSTPDRIFDFLPFLFPQYLNSALQQGLYKEYQTREYNNTNLRGTIDINRHIRFNIPANGKIAYRAREYSFDNPVTELVRHTIEYMGTNDIFKYILTRNQETKDAVLQIVNATPLYNRMACKKILAQTEKTIKSPYFYKYRNLQKICRMILLREKIKYDSSANKIYGILFDGAWLWEEYLATLLKDKGFTHPQNKNCSGGFSPFTGTQTGRFYPDFYRQKTGTENYVQADIVLDAKYKEFDTANPHSPDLHQMISYIHVLDADKGMFVYPSTSEEKLKNDWNLKKYNGKSSRLGVLPFLIPQEKFEYSEFVEEMEKSEEKFRSFNM